MVRVEDDGFTLVELLVAISVLAVVSAVVVTSIVQGIQISATTTARVDQMTQLQIVHERMSRQLRAANPIVNVTPTAITVQVLSEVDPTSAEPQRTVQVEYRTADGQLVQTIREGATTSMLTLLEDVPDGQMVFRYFDRNGQPVVVPAGGLLGPQASTIAQIQVALATRPDPATPPIGFTTSVFIRNVGVES